MRQRKASFASETYIPFSNLSKIEQSEFGSLYKKCEQRDGGISFYDFVGILKTTFSFGEEKKKEILNEISTKTIRILDLHFLLTTASSLKKQKQFNNEHKPLTGELCTFLINQVDSFVALGGNIDGSGFISRNSLLNTMINEFDLQVDLDVIDLKGMNQQRLNYEQFCQLFQNPENSLIRTDSVQSVRINPQDFDNYQSKLTL